MNRTAIEWTDFSANPLKFRAPDGRVVWACEKLSPGCANCYAKGLADRYTDRRAGDWNAGVMKTLTPFLDEKELRRMLTYKPAAGKRCFVGDMTDIFGSWVPDDLLDRLFAVFALRGSVTWQLLTKRAERMREYVAAPSRSRLIVNHAIQIAADVDSRPEGGLLQTAFELEELITRGMHWPLPNVWLGVSCEDQQRSDERIPQLLQTPAAVRFISAEPLLGTIDLLRVQWPQKHRVDVLRGGTWELRSGFVPKGQLDFINHSDMQTIDWVIAGGENGPRGCNVAWIRSLVLQCRAAGVAAFVKQLGSRVIDRNDAGFSGEDTDSWPDFIDNQDRIEHDLDGTRDGYQGAPVRIHLVNRKGNDMHEWPRDLRVRQFPRSAVPA